MHNLYFSNSKFMTEDPITCISSINSERVIPYHWKGMNDNAK